MPSIVQQGSLNTTALVVPDLYVQIVPPSVINLNGIPTNVAGVIGTAQWGAVNTPVIVSDMASYARSFGAIQARKFDAGTAVALAVQQGAQNFRVVRVTDGTDTAAAAGILSNGMGLNARYTGTLGNAISYTVTVGSKAGSWKLTIYPPAGLGLPEVFDNLTGTGQAFYIAAVAAVNNGNAPLRGPSQWIVATIGVGTAAPTAVATPSFLGGGTDGASGVTATTLVGSDAIPRTGMYALRGQGCSLGMLADADDSTQWTTQAGFGLAEGVYMILTGPSGDTIANAVAVKATAGLDSYSAKLMFGDWLFWSDPVNAVLRLVSPQGFVLGRLANLSPEQSSLNKPLFGVVGSQKSGTPGSGAALTYSTAEMQALFGVGIDLICNPQPGGTYWGVRLGHNTSSNAAVSGDNYTRLTNYIAATLAGGMGKYVGRVVNAGLFRDIKATLVAFLQNMLGQGQLGTLDGSLPFNVLCSLVNNPFTRTSLGYVQADVQVQYQAINEKFIVNLQGGQTVVVAQNAGSSVTALAA